MRKYLRIYMQLLKINFTMLMMYRANFISHVFSSVLWGVFSIITILLLTSRTSSVYGWNREELLILTGVLNITLGIHRMFFSINFYKFAQVVHLGELDAILLKPMSSQFQLSFWHFGYDSVFRIVAAIIFTIFMFQQSNFSINFLQIVPFVAFLIIGVSLLYSITYILLTLTIWYPRLSNLLEIADISTTIIRYPKELFQEVVWYVFFILLPIVLIVSLPTKILFGKAEFQDMLTIFFVSIFLLYFSHGFWKFALKHYSSVSS